MSSTTYAQEGAPAIEDFLGLRVLWPKPGEQLARIEHEYDFLIYITLMVRFIEYYF